MSSIYFIAAALENKETPDLYLHTEGISIIIFIKARMKAKKFQNSANEVVKDNAAHGFAMTKRQTPVFMRFAVVGGNLCTSARRLNRDLHHDTNRRYNVSPRLHGTPAGAAVLLLKKKAVISEVRAPRLRGGHSMPALSEHLNHALACGRSAIAARWKNEMITSRPCVVAHLRRNGKAKHRLFESFTYRGHHRRQQ